MIGFPSQSIYLSRTRFPVRTLAAAGLSALLGFSLSTAAYSASDPPPQMIRLAVVEMTETGFEASTIIPVQEAIQEAFPDRTVSILRINSATLESTVKELRPDFIISPAADFLRILDAVGAHPIATRKTKWAKDPYRSTGAAIIARSTRIDLSDLRSLRGMRAAATLPLSLDGWLAFRGELSEVGIDSEGFFKRVRYFGYGMPHVVEAVLSESYDVGIVPVCTLERIEADGLIEPGVLKVVAQKEAPESLCRTSTALYPDLTFSALSAADPEVVRVVTAHLLAAQGGNEYAWYPASDFHSVRALEEQLHIGPWAYLEETTPSALWRRWRYWILGLAALFGLLILSEIRLRKLVSRRTSDLTLALKERDRLAASEEEVRTRLSRLERMGAVSQLCAIVAHELKQPVGAVINYLAVVRLKTGLAKYSLPLQDDAAKAPDPILEQAVNGADREARRIAEIVDRVRSYARAEKSNPAPVDLEKSLRSAVSGLKRLVKVAFVVRAPDEPLIILGDALELELIFHNLIKNAAEAASDMPDGTVTATLMRDGHQAVAEILDNGRRLDESAFEKLLKSSGSSKTDGLGLGLGIVRNLVEENGGRFTISRRRDLNRGISVVLRFDLAVDSETDENGLPI